MPAPMRGSIIITHAVGRARHLLQAARFRDDKRPQQQPATRVQWLLVGVGCVAVAVSSAVVSFAHGQLDDAYITYTFARNVAEGHGFVWYEGGPQVYGSSTVTYTLLLALFVFLGLTAPAASVLLSSLSWALAYLVVIWLVFDRIRWPFALLIPILGAASIGALSSSAGMETGFYSLLCVSCFAVYASGRPRESLLLGVLLVLTRLDGALVPALIAVHLLLCAEGGFRQRLWHVARIVWPAAVVLAVALLALVAYFGSPLPASFLAKANFDEGITSEFSYRFYRDFLGGDLGFYSLGTLAVVGGLRLLPSWRDPLLLLAVWVPSYVALFEAWDFPPEGWYYPPIFPALFGAAALGADFLARRWVWPGTLVAATLLSLALVSLPFGVTTNIPVEKPQEVLARAVVDDARNKGVKGPEVVAYEVGYEGYLVHEAGGRVHDILGLVSPDAVEAGSWRNSLYLMSKYDPDYVVIEDTENWPPTAPLLTSGVLEEDYEHIYSTPADYDTPMSPGYSSTYTVFAKKDR
jgi:hypothetical protein